MDSPSVPLDVYRHIFSFADVETAAALRRCCKSFASLSVEQHLDGLFGATRHAEEGPSAWKAALALVHCRKDQNMRPLVAFDDGSWIVMRDERKKPASARRGATVMVWARGRLGYGVTHSEGYENWTAFFVVNAPLCALKPEGEGFRFVFYVEYQHGGGAWGLGIGGQVLRMLGWDGSPRMLNLMLEPLFEGGQWDYVKFLLEEVGEHTATQQSSVNYNDLAARFFYEVAPESMSLHQQKRKSPERRRQCILQ